MRAKKTDPKVLELDDLEKKRFWAAIILLIGLGLAVYGAGELLQASSKMLDQVDELSERVERLSVPAASTSEPPST